MSVSATQGGHKETTSRAVLTNVGIIIKSMPRLNLSKVKYQTTSTWLYTYTGRRFLYILGVDDCLFNALKIYYN